MKHAIIALIGLCCMVSQYGFAQVFTPNFFAGFVIGALFVVGIVEYMDGRNEDGDH